MRPNDFITYDCALPECEALTFGDTYTLDKFLQWRRQHGGC